MKKIATLEVWEVEENDPERYESSAYGFRDIDRDFHKIVLNPYENGGKDRTGVFAHELGHFVTHVMKLPTAMDDMEVKRQYGPLATFLAGDTVIAEEKMAWEIAEKMGVPIMQEDKAKALMSYGASLSEIPF